MEVYVHLRVVINDGTIEQPEARAFLVVVERTFTVITMLMMGIVAMISILISILVSILISSISASFSQSVHRDLTPLGTQLNRLVESSRPASERAFDDEFAAAVLPGSWSNRPVCLILCLL